MSDENLTVTPYGTWPSPLSASDLAESATHLTDLCTADGTVFWLQSDPTRGGRYAVMKSGADGVVRKISPDGFNARTRVHEYGGGALGAGHGVVLACEWTDQRVHLVTDGETTPVTREPSAPAGIRWAAMAVLPGGAAFVAVRETHGDDRPRSNTNVHGDEEAVNELVRVDIASGDETVLVTGPDFIGGPWLDADGVHIAWLQWNHPDMPWDSAELWTAPLGPSGLDERVHVAGGSSSVCDALWDGERLVFSDDTSGWWNLSSWTAVGGVERMQDEPVETGAPRWLNGGQRLAVLDDTVFAITSSAGFSHVRRFDGSGDGDALELDGIGSVGELRATDTTLIAIAGGPARPTAVVAIDPELGFVSDVSAVDDHPASRVGAVPEAVSFPTPDRSEAHALLYRPTSRTHAAPADELPPLIVLSHGGPTSAASTALNAGAQYWVSRGFAVVDVDYRGSVGYGRDFRDALKGNWGRHDVTDCIAAAQFLADRGEIDGDRLLIEGGSAGGYTTLLALCTTNTFAAGGSLFGVSDLRALATDTHKFESRYLDSMIGRWPDDEAVYIERSPISHVEELSTPMIVLQGDEDVVVPPAQAELIVDALKRKGIAHAYLLFEGEQHGFRQARNITRALEARLSFYCRILEIEPADRIDLPEFVDAR